MSPLPIDERAIRARSSLLDIDNEGLLLNTETGAVHRLNPTGYEIWSTFIRGHSIGEVAEHLVRRFGLPSVQAQQDVISTITDIPAVNPGLVDQYRWLSTARGYGYFDGEMMLCEVDLAGKSLNLSTARTLSEVEARVHLKSVVPKLLALRKIFVLHAAAVEVHGTLLAFSGRSGAGKTTTAKAFSEASARLISQDLLLLAPDLQRGVAVRDGERAVHSWVARQARIATERPTHPIDCTGLDDCLSGVSLPIRSILLLAADRRGGDCIEAEVVTRPEAVAALIENTYFASDDSQSWIATLQSLRSIAKAVPVACATMPMGLRELTRAAEAFYRAMVTS